MEMQLQSILVLCILVVLIMLTFILAILLCCRIDVRVAAITTAGGTANTNTIGGLMLAENVEKDGEGLHPDVIENFPMVPYMSIQRLKNVRGRHGCAVCLSEFEIRDTLRMLPGCCHVFHPACIGAWLVSNVTCPICRSDLSDPAMLASDHCLIGDEKEPVMTEISDILEDGRLLRRASSVVLIRSSGRSSRWDAIVKTLSGRWRKDVSDSRRIAPLFVDSTSDGSTQDVEIGVITSSLEIS